MRSFQNIMVGVAIAGSLVVAPTIQITHAASGTHGAGQNRGTRSMSLAFIASVEGVTTKTLQKDLTAGQTLLHIASANHSKYASSAQALASALLVPFKARMDQAVRAHYMTPVQATQRHHALLSRWTALVKIPHPQLSGPARAMMVGSSEKTVMADDPWYGITDPGTVYNQGGPVMHRYRAYLIFWLPPGNTFEPSGSSSRYESLIQRYFRDVSATPFFDITKQYGDTSGAPNGSVSIGGVVVDKTNPYPHAGTTSDPLFDSDIQQEVSSVMQAKGWTASLDNAYFVFTGAGIESCQDASSTMCSFPSWGGSFYSGYHSFFTDPQSGQQVIYANMPDVSAELPASGTAANGTQLSPNGDWIADSEISVLSHEQFESVTDPTADAWADAAGQEIADKCVQQYGNLNGNGSDIVLHGHSYIVQAEWSNAAGGCALSA